MNMKIYTPSHPYNQLYIKSPFLEFSAHPIGHSIFQGEVFPYDNHLPGGTFLMEEEGGKIEKYFIILPRFFID